MFRYLMLSCLVGVFAFDSGAALAATKVKSISDTFAVGTLIAVPSSLPSNFGKTKLKAFAAPVDVGINELDAVLALRKSL